MDLQPSSPVSRVPCVITCQEMLGFSGVLVMRDVISLWSWSLLWSSICLSLSWGVESTSKISVMCVSGGFWKHFSLCVPFGMLVHVHRILYWVEQALGLCYALRVCKSSVLNTSLTTACQHHCLVPLEAGCLPILSNSLLSINGYTHTLCSGLVS